MVEPLATLPVGVPFADPIAILNPATTGPWKATQQAQATVFMQAGAGDYYPEIELHLNMTIEPHKITGYEFDCGIMNHPVNPPSCTIVRWNGPLANATNSNNGFTWISPTVDVVFSTGDVLRAVNTGSASNNLQVFKNGTLIVSATDHTFTSGSPGIGVNGSDSHQINNYADEGFTSFSASNL
jgi:hypothetical protein